MYTSQNRCTINYSLTLSLFLSHSQVLLAFSKAILESVELLFETENVLYNVQSLFLGMHELSGHIEHMLLLVSEIFLGNKRKQF